MDFTSPNDPFQTPLGAAIPDYASISPTTGATLGAMAGATTRRVGELFTRFPEYTAEVAQGLSEGQYQAPEPQPLLSPDEINKRYAEKGSPITERPLTDEAGRILGKAHSDQMDRDAVIQRYMNAHGMATNFGVGTLGFLMDPLGASTALVPGLGEEAILAKTGTGILGRTAARLGAGAAGGAAAIAPVTALEYATDPDYTLRDAFKDMFFGATANAVFHAGFGGFHDMLKRPDAITHQEAMKSALSQVADGRPVEVEPFFPPPPTETAVGAALREVGEPIITGIPGRTVSDTAQAQRSLYANGYAPGIPQPEFLEGWNSIYGPKSEPIEKILQPAKPPIPVGEEKPLAEKESAQEILNRPEVREAIDRPRAIVRDYDVPYLAGSNESGGVTYIDRRLPQEVELPKADGSGTVTVDPAKYLTVHEQAEHALMVEGDLSYEGAHELATAAERKAVEADGIDWNAYQRAMLGFAKDVTEGEHAANPPPDLYTKPYPHNEAEFLKRKGEAPVPKGHIRLYRGETDFPNEKARPVSDWIRENPEYQGMLEATGRWFNADRATAEYYNQQFGDKTGRVSYVDIPVEDAEKYLSANQPEAKRFSAQGREHEEYFIPKELAAGRKPLGGESIAPNESKPDPDIAAMQQLLAATGPIHPDDAAEIAQASQVSANAEQLQGAYDEAANCLAANGGL